MVDHKQVFHITEDMGIVMITIPVCLFLEPQVRVSRAQAVPHLMQTPDQVYLEGSTTRLQLI